MVNNELVLAGLTGSVAAIELGARNGSTIIGIHGWLDNAASFMPLAEQLPFYRWISVDLPGHGKSQHRPDGCVYHYTDFVADLYNVVQSLGIERCDLVGHSLGAGIAAIFAAVFPDRVNRLIMIDGVGPFSGKDDGGLIQLRKSMAFFAKNRHQGPRRYDSWESLINKRLDAGEIKHTSAEMLLRRGSTREPDGVMIMSDSRLKQPSPIFMSEEKVITLLNGITAPTLLVVANDGLIGSRPSTESRANAISNLKRVNVDGFHHAHMDNPKLVAVEIERFLNP